MKRNIDRVSKIIEAGVESGKFIQSCFDWESKPRSITAFAVSCVDCLIIFSSFRFIRENFSDKRKHFNLINH